MGTKPPSLEFGFTLIEEMAKDPSTPETDICDNLAVFLSSAGYRRAPFSMHFEGLFRARSVAVPTIEQACFEFGNVSKLSYPPDWTNPRASRCNPEGRPVFYCANDSGVPIFEIRAEAGQYVAFTLFRHPTKKRIDIRIPIIGSEYIRDKLMARDPKNPMIKILEQDIHFKKHGDKRTIQLDRRLAEWFKAKVDDDNKYIYRLTNAYYEMFVRHMSDGGRKVQGLLFPSIESESTGYNMVFETDFVDKNLVVQEVTVWQVLQKAGKNYILKPIKQNGYINEFGDIGWLDYGWYLAPTSPTVSFNGA
jgi:hypothetical protein